MFGSSRELHAKLNALSRSQAVVEFNLDGTIITANENFLNVLGYGLDEIRGKHHSMFVDPAEKDSAAYRELWQNLNRGQFQTGGIQAPRQGRQAGLDSGVLQPADRGQRQALQGGEVCNRDHGREDA